MIHRLTMEAFWATPETAEALEKLKAERLMARSRMEITPGGMAAAVERYAHAPTPQVVVVEETDAAQLMPRLEQLAEVSVQGTRVIVVGGVNDIALYRAMMAAGVSEYLLHPVTPRQLMASLERLFADPQAGPKGRVIAFWGARGGVGSSTLAQNAAWELARRQGEPVIYADLDVAFGTSTLAFNLEAKQTVADALASPERLDEVLMERCMVEYDDHLRILAAPGDGRIHAQPTVEAADGLVALAARLAPLVILDLPRLWADWTEHLLAHADEVVVTGLPDFASLRDAKAVLDALSPRRSGLAAPRLVLNRVEPGRKTQLSAKDFEDTIKVAPFLQIPNDPQSFGEAANAGQMVGEVAKSGKAAAALMQLAQGLAGKAPVAAKAQRRSAMDLLGWLRR